VIDIVSKIEKRSEFAYILNHEAGLYVGRFSGAATFLIMARYGSAEIALRYAVIIIAVLQLCSIFVAKKIIQQGKKLSPEEATDKIKVVPELVQGALV
jgi:YQGE family putative transporter